MLDTRLTVLEQIGKDRYSHPLVRCRCACGNEITARLDNVKARRTMSCGCFRRQSMRGNRRRKKTK
jgi:hypothetical protein